MEATERKLSASAETSDKRDPDPESSGKIRRLSRETRGLVEDVKSWVELRMTLTQMDVEDRIDARLNRAIVGTVVAAVGFLGLTFALVAGALALGSWLGHVAWGFLIVAGLLLLITVLLVALKPRVVSVSGNNAKSENGNG